MGTQKGEETRDATLYSTLRWYIQLCTLNMIGTDADETGESAMSDGHKLIEAVTSQDINTLKELIKARHKLNTKVQRRCSTPCLHHHEGC